MPVDLSDLLAERKELDVKYHDFVICITYNPNVQTEVMEDMIRDQINDEKFAASIRTFLVRSITKWDLTDGGHPLPITDDVIKTKVPTALQVVLIQAIQEDIRGPEVSGSSVVR